MKKIVLVILALILAVGLTGCPWWHHHGYPHGYDRGYDRGYDHGSPHHRGSRWEFGNHKGPTL